MSGGNCPETPRQKMIGMMYLFLTAMLALNVSGELLKAFELVDRSIQQTTTTIQQKNRGLYSALKADADNNERAKEPWSNAQKVRAAADSLVGHMQNLKLDFVHLVGGEEATLEAYTGADNQDKAAQWMITERGGERSKILKDKIGEYKKLLLSLVNEKDTLLRGSIEKVLNTEDPKGLIAKSWESEKFEHLPMSASLALMSKLISDVRNTEADVLKYLSSSVDENTFKFTKVDPIVIPKSEVVMRGGEYYAEIMLTARDEDQKPTIRVNGSEIPVNDQNIGIYKVGAGATGKRSINAEITVLGPDGEDKTYSVNKSYEVVEPMVVISPTKMNVFYEGVENPVMISVPGLTSNQLEISVSNAAKPVKKGDEYLVRVNSGMAGAKSKITVVGNIDGNRRTIGSMEFRIKRIPPPIAKVAGINEGKLSKARLLAESGVFAEMEDFDFELEYKVSRFNVSIIKNGYNVDEASTNNRFTDTQKELIKGLPRGSKVFINDIKAVGPDKVTKSLGSVTLTLD